MKKRDTIEMRPFPLESFFLILFGIILVVLVVGGAIGGVVVFRLDQLLILVPLVLALVLGAYMVYKGIRMICNPSVTLRLSSNGLWIAKDKLEVPWEHIKRAEVIDPRDRKSEVENLTGDVMSIALRGRTQRILLSVITLTKIGRKSLGGKDYIGWYYRRTLGLEEDLVLPASLFQSDEMVNVTQEIQRRAEEAREERRAAKKQQGPDEPR